MITTIELKLFVIPKIHNKKRERRRANEEAIIMRCIWSDPKWGLCPIRVNSSRIETLILEKRSGKRIIMAILE